MKHPILENEAPIENEALENEAPQSQKRSTQKLENRDPKNSKTKTPKLETGLSFINWLESLLLIHQESSTIMNRMQFKSTTYTGFEFWVLRFRDLGASCFGLRFRVLCLRNNPVDGQNHWLVSLP